MWLGAWTRVGDGLKVQPTTTTLDGVALNLHGFYAGLERIFELVAGVVDGDKPMGENWHQALLLQMVAERPPTRPAVISESVREQLDDYRGFRHVVRNVYTFRFDRERVGVLVEGLARLFPCLRAEIDAFAAFLEQRA